MKILIINGPNLNMLGMREEKHYGNLRLKDINANLRSIAKGKAKLKFFQSNYEGALVSAIQKHLKYDAIIINAGAYTHTSIAIHDALEMFKGKIIEVHLSDVNAREDFRKVNYITPIASKTITGLKEKGYYEALKTLLNQ